MYLDVNGQVLGDAWDDALDVATEYGENIVGEIAGQAKEAVIDKAGELLGRKPDEKPAVTPPPATTQPATQTSAGTVTPAPNTQANPAPTNAVMTTVKQFPGWGVGLAAGAITYMLSKSIIGGLAVAGGGWLLFDKAVKK